jgi:hypothetical protein
MPLVEVPGEQEQFPEQPVVRHKDILKVKVKHAVRIDRQRSAKARSERDGVKDEDIVDVANDDVVEIEIQDNKTVLRRWIRGSELAAELGTIPTRTRSAGGGEKLVVKIPDSLPRRRQARGVGAFVIKALRVLEVDPVAATALAIAHKLEAKLVPTPGLYHWDSKGVLNLLTKKIEGPETILLFLHGTASKTMQGFGALVEPERQKSWAELCDSYNGRVYALEHKTLSESPIKNAIDALEMLPEGATLHLVSHSRGGLIGELLCRANPDRGAAGPKDEPFTTEENDLLKFEGQKAELKRLAELLTKKKPKVQRFVRVACPARGTILASERLDRYLTVVLNVLGYIPGLAGPAFGEVYDFLKTFLLAVVKERTKPETIPGLEAMMPSSPFQKIINRRDVIADGGLSVIKGDLEGQGLFDLASLKAFATDLFYREDHDLVVNTAAMDGGMARKDGSFTFFDQGPTVDHFSYFRNTRTLEQMRKMLRGETTGLSKIELRSKKVPVARAAARTRTDGRRAGVFVVPDFGGTLLSAQGKPIWPDDGALAAGEMAKLAVDKPDVVPEGLLQIYYGDLIKELETSHDVVPFPYDWRMSFADEGRRLAEWLDQRLKDTSDAVRIVAHGNGGLLVRATFGQSPALWRRFKDRSASRLIMLGVPHGGSFTFAQMLMGRDQTAQMLHSLDFAHNEDELLKLLAGFPGVLESLPRGGEFDLLSDAGWERLYASAGAKPAWSPPDRRALEAARNVRNQIDATPLASEFTLYIAGQGITVDGITIEKSEPGTPAAPAAADRIVFKRTQEGDGRSSWKSAISPGTQAWYSAAVHGDLSRDLNVIRAVTDLLVSGNTEKLSRTAPAVDHLAAEPIETEKMEVYPQADDLATAALGGSFVQPTIESTEAINISVVHGNLAFARNPLVVGHYRGDGINGAEAHLDRMLGGRMTNRRRLGLYADEIGTTELVLDAADETRGAIVVGLGDAGRLSLGELRRTLTRGLLRYAAYWLEKRKSTGGDIGEKITVSTLLVGSGEGGLPAGTCVTALAEALYRAQRALAGQGAFGAIEIIELYEHRALQILRQLKRMESHGSTGFLRCEREIRSGEGGRRRIAIEEDREWYQPVNITMEPLAETRAPDEQPRMRFVVPTDMARAEAAVLPTHKIFVDNFIKQSIAGRSGGQYGGSPGRALFELLIPDLLKERTRDDRHLRLILDQKTAAYPWELMDDRRPWDDEDGPVDKDRKPPAVRAGMVRQLVTRSFRQRLVRARGAKALIIGDPRGDVVDTAASAFPELPGAQFEAEAVGEKLASKCTVTKLIGKSVRADDVVMQLCANDWSLIHIAAHGTLYALDGNATGVVLADGMILTADMLRQLLPVTPELVFVNCCHLGNTDSPPVLGNPHEFAASIATGLIDMGVTAVIAAGWAVDDQAASQFAQTFYEEMLGGATFAVAVKTARAKIYEQFPGQTTWGAYQCYGEPDWQFQQGERQHRTQSRSYCSIAELIADVDQIGQDAQTGMARSKDAEFKKLEQMLEEGYKVNQKWENNPDLLTSLGRTYGELGEFGKACDCYLKAIRSERASASLRSIEQLANLQIRSAVVARAKGTKYETIGKDALKSINALARLAGGNDTIERLTLRGACHKRLAQVLRGKKRDRELAQMADWYAKAEKQARDGGRINPYPMLMCISARVAAAVRAPGGKGILTPAHVKLLDEARKQSRADDQDTPNFWSAVAEADATLLEFLAKGVLGDAERKTVEEAYLKRWNRGGSWLKFRSVLEQIRFFIDVWDDGDDSTRAKRDDLRNALTKLYDELEHGIQSKAEES